MPFDHLTFRSLGVLLALSCLPRTAHALLESCEVAAVSVDFGSYDPASPTPRDAVGNVMVTCEVSIAGLFSSWNILLSTGISGAYAGRQLSSGAASLEYNLYVDSARTSVWGDGSPGTTLVSDSTFLLVGGNVFTYPIYGRIRAWQNAPPGSYADNITVTLNY